MRDDTLFISLIGLLCVVGCGPDQAQPQAPSTQAVVVPTSWARLPSLPDYGTESRQCAGRLSLAWTVSTNDNRLRVFPETRFPVKRERDPLPYEIDFTGAIEEPPPPPPPPNSDQPPKRQLEWAIDYARNHAGRTVTLVDDGWFVAFDAGENGGSLWWYPRAPGPGRKLWPRNVRWLFRDGADLIALGGLAHLSVADGVMLRLSRTQEGWAVVHQHSLVGAPSVVAIDPLGRIVIATTGSVERVQGDATEVIARTNYGHYPYSIAMASGGGIAVGLRMFVHVLQPDGPRYRDEWYVPSRCRTFEQRDFECICTGPDA